MTADNTEENLYLINDIPGVYAQGYFEPGDQVGDTRLKLNVTKESWFDTSVRIDNHGAKTTGENRLYGEFVLHNPQPWVMKSNWARCARKKIAVTVRYTTVCLFIPRVCV